MVKVSNWWAIRAGSSLCTVKLLRPCPQTCCFLAARRTVAVTCFLVLFKQATPPGSPPPYFVKRDFISCVVAVLLMDPTQSRGVGGSWKM